MPDCPPGVNPREPRAASERCGGRHTENGAGVRAEDSSLVPFGQRRCIEEIAEQRQTAALVRGGLPGRDDTE